MDNLSINLINFALNMHTVKQAVASQNIANADFKTKLVTDFSEHLQRIEKLPNEQKLEYLKVLNSQDLSIQQGVVTDSKENISIEAEHAESTKAMLEFQAMVEVVNRKMSMMSLVLGGQR
jgi:flagellar basal body rod protein FlgB